MPTKPPPSHAPAGGTASPAEGSAPAGMPRWIGVLAANVVGVLLLLLALEGAVRVVRPDIGPAGSDRGLFLDSAFVDVEGRTTGLRPGATGDANGVSVRVTNEGVHAYAGNETLPDSAGAWLWLGDSVLFGVGVAQDSTVAGRLAAQQDTARILNPAVLGWGTADYRRRLDAALASGLRPGRVTVLWCLNDADPARPSAAGEVSALESAKRDARVWLNVHSRLYRLAKDLAMDRPLRYFEHDRRFYTSLASGDEGSAIERALDDLWAIQDTLAARGIPLDVVIGPYEPQLRPGGSRRPQEALVTRLRQRGVPTLDLFDAFAAAGDAPETLYLWSDGIHWSGEGHGVAAEAVARWRPHR